MTLAERFWVRVNRTDTCWLWTGTTDQRGYGLVKVGGGRRQTAQRVAYQLVVGPIPDGHGLANTCGTRRCVNPAHWEPMTSSALGKRQPPPLNIRPAQERFDDLVDRSAGPDGCWPWQGFRSDFGHGKFKVKVGDRWVTTGAYRFAYEQLVGPVPDGLVIDHLCRNPPCCNPAHLEPVTPRENTLRGVGAPAVNARKTHCHRGHEFTPENTYLHQGSRHCRRCAAERRRAS